MAKASVYSIVLAPELRDAFMAAAEASGRPPAQVLRSLMREFVQRQQEAADNEAAAGESVDTDASNLAADAAPSTGAMASGAAGAAAAVTAEAAAGENLLPADDESDPAAGTALAEIDGRPPPETAAAGNADEQPAVA